LANPVVDTAFAELSRELEAIKWKLLAEQESFATSHKKAAHSLSPSELSPDNIHHARGSVDLHDRDSGVARHAAFLAVLQSLVKRAGMQKGNFSLRTARHPLRIRSDPQLPQPTLIRSLEICATRFPWLKLLIRVLQPMRLNSANLCFSEELQLRLSLFCEKCALPNHFSHQYPTMVSGSGEDKSDIACFSLDENDFRRLRGHIEVRREDATGARWQVCGYAAETFHEKVFLSFCMTIDHQNIALYGFMQSTDPGNQKRTFVESILCSVELPKITQITWRGCSVPTS
jgi:hypothetical protein